MSNSIFCSFQWFAISIISAVKSLNVNPLNAVWVESTAVGKTDVSTPKAEIMGNATVREHFPTHDISCIVNILFILFKNFLKQF